MASRVTAGLVVALALLLGACGSTDEPAAIIGTSTSDDDGYRGIKLDRPYDVPHVALEATDGSRFDLAAQDKRTLVFFGYTNCPDICQVVMSTVASAVSRLSPEEQQRLQVVFVTTDPARDSTEVLSTYLDRFDPDFRGVTGPLRRVVTLGKPLGIDVLAGEKLPSGGYEVDHTTNVISVHRGRGDLVWTAATSPADVAADLEKILKADS